MVQEQKQATDEQPKPAKERVEKPEPNTRKVSEDLPRDIPLDEAPEPVRPCRACGTPMYASAKLCSVCLTYRSRFRAALPLLAITAALTILAVAVGVYAFTQGRSYWAAMYPEERILVIDVNTASGILLSNPGDTDEFVTRLVIESPQISYSRQYAINRVLPAGQFVSMDIDGPKGGFVAGLDNNAWKQLVAYMSRYGRDGVFAPVFFHPDNVALADLKLTRKPLNTLSASAVVHFVSAKTGNAHESARIDLVGVLTQAQGTAVPAVAAPSAETPPTDTPSSAQTPATDSSNDKAQENKQTDRAEQSVSKNDGRASTTRRSRSSRYRRR